jgi:hypothetical protein
MFVRLINFMIFAGLASAEIPSLNGYKRVFSDDFEGSKGAAVDHGKWDLKEGGGANGEKQIYKDSTANAHLSGDGQLYIIPKKENGQWTSARLESWFSAQADAGGAMVFQAELQGPNFYKSPPKFDGLWPSFWYVTPCWTFPFYPTKCACRAKGQSYRNSPGTPWPKCGEWDIFEVTNKMSNRNQGTLHFSKAAGCDSGSSCDDGSFSGSVLYTGDAYHTWALKVDRRYSDWTQERLTWYWEGNPYYTVTGGMIGDFSKWQDLAHTPYYMILNMAVGGGYPGNPTDATVSGYDASLRVKYVAIYKTV